MSEVGDDEMQVRIRPQEHDSMHEQKKLWQKRLRKITLQPTSDTYSINFDVSLIHY